MPNQKQNKPEPTIEKQIGELVTSMNKANEKLAEEIKIASKADEQFETDAMNASAVQAKDKTEALNNASVGETVENAKEPSATEAETIEDTTAEPVAEATDAADNEGAQEAMAEAQPTLDDQVEEMLESASVASAQPSESTTVDAVDEELASLADDLLEGDFDDADSVLSADVEAPRKPAANPDATQTAPAPAETVAGEALSEMEIDEDDLLDGDFGDAEDVIAQGDDTPAPAKPTPEEAPKAEAPAPPQEPKAKAPEPKAEPPNPKPQPKPEPKAELEAEESEEESAPEVRTVRHTKPAKARKERLNKDMGDQGRVRVLAGAALAGTGAAAYRVAELVNKPLDAKPAKAKDIAGWLAAVTLFNAAAVWVFLLIGRGPAQGTSEEPAVELVGQTPAVSIE